MRLTIDYLATYTYEEPVSLSPHLARVFPRADLDITVENTRFFSDASADVQMRRDLFDNMVAHCFFPDNLARMEFSLHLQLEMRERNPFHFLLDAGGQVLPCLYTNTETALLQEFLKPLESLALPEPLAPTSPRPTVESLVAINSWIHNNISYERREHGHPFSPAETLRRCAGSCRDFAVLMADVLRLNGVAARLASGFVWEGDRTESERRAESAMHAWVEAYLPGAGWLGIDPTNGVFCDHHFVTTAVGLSPADIAPIAGTYFSDKKVASHLETRIDISKE